MREIKRWRWLKQTQTERAGGGGVLGRSGTGGSRGRLDGGVVCVCFAVLGVPLGSASLTGGGEGLGI